MDAPDGAALPLSHDGLDGLGIALIAPLQILQKRESRLRGSEIRGELGDLLLHVAQDVVGFGGLIGAALLVVSSLLQPLPGLIGGGVLLFLLFLQIEQLLRSLGPGGLEVVLPIQQGLAHVRQHGDFRAALGQSGTGLPLPLQQKGKFFFRRARVGCVGGEVVFDLFNFSGDGRLLPADLLQTGLALGDLGVQGLDPVGLLGGLQLHSGDALGVGLQVRPQDGQVALALSRSASEICSLSRSASRS